MYCEVGLMAHLTDEKGMNPSSFSDRSSEPNNRQQRKSCFFGARGIVLVDYVRTMMQCTVVHVERRYLHMEG